jgi:adenosine deaminase
MASLLPSGEADAVSLAFLAALPKAELHSHLNGTIRRATLLELLAAHAPELLPAAAADSAAGALPPSLDACFRLFACIHRAVCTEAAVARVAREAVEDAAADGVRYLELRTTPRALPGAAGAGGAGEDAALHRYVEAAATGILAGSAAHPRIAVRLLLSFDRAAGAAAWRAALRVAIAWRARAVLGLQPFPAAPTALVVGVDVSGHPGRGELAALLPLLDAARAAGLRAAVHCGELAGSDAEVAAVLAWRPDRLGHMCALAPATLKGLLAGAAAGAALPPIELCPTSNAVTLRLARLAEHPTMGAWLGAAAAPAGPRVAICTDDCGVFNTRLSAEYAAAGAAFALGRARLAEMAAASFDAGFAPQRELEAARLL